MILRLSTQIKRASAMDEKRWGRTDGSYQHRPDVVWGEISFLSPNFNFFGLFQVEDLVVKSILCGLTSLKEEMNTGQKKEVFSSLAPAARIFRLVSGEVNVQHVQAAWLRHPARLPPKTPPHWGQRKTGVPKQPIGRFCQQTHGWFLISYLTSNIENIFSSRSTKCSK